MSDIENSLNDLESKIQKLCFFYIKKCENEKQIFENWNIHTKKNKILELENENLKNMQKQIKLKIEALIDIVQKNLDSSQSENSSSEEVENNKNSSRENIQNPIEKSIEDANQKNKIFLGENKIQFFENENS